MSPASVGTAMKPEHVDYNTERLACLNWTKSHTALPLVLSNESV